MRLKFNTATDRIRRIRRNSWQRLCQRQCVCATHTWYVEMGVPGNLTLLYFRWACDVCAAKWQRSLNGSHIEHEGSDGVAKTHSCITHFTVSSISHFIK